MEFKIQNIIFKLEEITLQRKYKIQKPKHCFQCKEIAVYFSYKFKTIDLILMYLEILLHKHRAVIKVPGVAKQTANRK